jgi:hypothetical protein
MAAALVAVAWLALAAPASADTEVRATLEPEVIGVAETATLTLEVRSDGFGRLRFRPGFDLDNLEIVGGPDQEEGIRFVNGRLSRAFRLSWRLRPGTTGPARVRNIGILLRGHLVQIGDRGIQVQEEPTGAAARQPWEDESDDPLERLLDRFPYPRPRRDVPAAFLRAEIEPRNPYVGEQVLYTVHLYTREEVLAATAREIPTFKGFWVRDIPQPQRLPTDLVDFGGERYSRAVLLQKALFPLRPGRYVVEPSAMDLMVRTVERRFFGPPVSRPEQLLLRTQPKVVAARPLPPAPSGFGGAVGRMSLAARVEPREIRLGEAATLTLTLAGEGNLQGIEPPRVAAPAGLALLPPQQGGGEEVAGTEVHGSRTWSFVVIPKRSGRYTLSVPEIPYFDPESGQYRTASAPPVALAALPKLPQAAAPPAAGSLHGIRSASFAAGAPAWRPLLPWLFALPWAVVLVVTLARRRSPVPLAARRDAGGGGHRSAHRRLEGRLADAAAESRPRQAAAHVEEAWREFLATRWGVPAATPSARWPELLAGHGADPEAARELVQLMDDLHYLRYAPQLSATETLRAEALDRCRRLLRRLR